MKQRIKRYILFDLAIIALAIPFIAIVLGGRCTFGDKENNTILLFLLLTFYVAHFVFSKKYLQINNLNSFVCSLIIFSSTGLIYLLLISLVNYLPSEIFDFFILFILGLFVFNNYLWEKAYSFYYKRRNSKANS